MEFVLRTVIESDLKSQLQVRLHIESYSVWRYRKAILITALSSKGIIIACSHLGHMIEVVTPAKGNLLLGNLRTTPRATSTILVLNQINIRRPHWWGGFVNLFWYVIAFDQSDYSIDQSNFITDVTWHWQNKFTTPPHQHGRLLIW